MKPHTTTTEETMLAPSTTTTISYTGMGKISRQVTISTLPNSSDLVDRLVGDVAVGCGVTFFVAPFVSVLDKAIVQKAAGTHTLLQSSLQSIKIMAGNPAAFLKSPAFLWMWAVYAATYSTANSLKTITEYRQREYGIREENDTKGKVGIFLGTTFSNAGFAVLKDRAYARLFGTACTKVPMFSYGVWLTRDFTVIGSSFILPDIMSKTLQDKLSMEEAQAKSLAQLTAPVAGQLVAGPLHLLGLDLYNRPLQGSWKSAVMNRTRFLVNGYVSVCCARIARIAPAYGIGGVFNTRFRDQWREYLSERNTSSGHVWMDLFHNHHAI